MKIEIIAGSPREHSVTRRLALHLLNKLTQETEHEVGLIDVSDNPLPPIQKVITSAADAPGELKELSSRMLSADAFIIVTPEYNGSYTPVMKNLLDHYPKQSHKAFGIVTASTGIMGGIRATQSLLVNSPLQSPLAVLNVLRWLAVKTRL